MAKDYFTEEIGSSKDFFSEEISKSSGLLDKIKESVTSSVSQVPAIQALRELPQTLLGTFHGATLGFPREILKRTANIDIPRGNLPGQIVGFALGPGGKLAAGAGALAKVGGPILRPVLQGAIEGGVGGFLFPQEDLTDMNARMITGGIGIPFGIGGRLIGSFYQGLKQAGDARKAIKALKNEELLIKETQLKSVDPTIEARKGVLQTRTSRLQNKLVQLKKQETQIFNDRIKDIETAINKESQGQAQSIKEPINDYLKSFKEQWGQSFDDALETAQGKGIAIERLRQLGDETVDELLEMGIDPRGQVVRTIQRNVSRFKPETEVRNIVTTRPGLMGEPVETVVQETVEKSGQLVKNRDLINIRRQVNRSLSPQAARGQFTEEDIAGAIFNRKLGEELGSNIPDLAGLNESYKRFSDLAKFTFKNFRPKASEFDIKSGTSLLGRYARGKANTGEISAINELEKETGIKFTKNLRELGNQLNSMKDLKRSRILQVENSFKNRIRKLNFEKEKLSQSVRLQKPSQHQSKIRLLEIDKKINDYNNIIDGLRGITRTASLIGAGATMSGTFGAMNAIGVPKSIKNLFDLMN